MTTQKRATMASNSSSPSHDTARRARRRRGPSGLMAAVIATALVVAILLGAACGDSGTAPASPMVTPATPAQTNAAAQAGAGKQAGLRFHAKIEDLIGEEQAQLIRHKFKPDDFGPNIGGTGRRDPFRSAKIVIRPEEATEQIDPTQACKDVVADGFSIRDMRLVGIVLRGTRSYALFVDKGEKGHIVTKGDCLGVEKARVLSVRAGFVTLQLYPDTTQPTAESELQERTIALYPDELSVDGETP